MRLLCHFYNKIKSFFQELIPLSAPIFCGEPRHKRISTSIRARTIIFIIIFSSSLSFRRRRNLHKKLHEVSYQSLSSYLRRFLLRRNDKLDENIKVCLYIFISSFNKFFIAKTPPAILFIFLN